MNQANYTQAEKLFRQALEISPHDPDIRLNLAKLFEINNNIEPALQMLQGTAQSTPEHVRTLYMLSRISAGSEDAAIRETAAGHIETVVQKWPANIVSKLQLVEHLIEDGQTDRAFVYLESIGREFPQLADESAEFYRQTRDLLRTGNAQQALTACRNFHQSIQILPIYKRHLQDLNGPDVGLQGWPVRTFGQDLHRQLYNRDITEQAIRFSDISAESPDVHRLSRGTVTQFPVVAAGDYDNDGDEDLYVSLWIDEQNKNTIRLFRNDNGDYIDIGSSAGLSHHEQDITVSFADFDNDGFLDILVVNKETCHLYRNNQGRFFMDASEKAGILEIANCLAVSFADFDQDGDLDLFVCRDGSNRLYRNNDDETFNDITTRTLSGGSGVKSVASYSADFDDDGDPDLLVVNEDARSALYANLGDGQFEDVTAAAGLSNVRTATDIAIADFNNDGTQDFFVPGRESRLFENAGKASFLTVSLPETTLSAINELRLINCSVVDYDNDGRMDLLLTGVPGRVGGSGVMLLRNTGDNVFEPVTNHLPDDLKSSRDAVISDIDSDGDMDLLTAEFDGSLRILRNDGGNANGYLKIALTGLRLAKNKNNYFGIGAKLEVHAGDLYQVRNVTKSVINLGLGPRTRVEALRVVWPNGEKQNEFHLQDSQTLVEKQNR
jgi:hypothetical protein